MNALRGSCSLAFADLPVAQLWEAGALAQAGRTCSPYDFGRRVRLVPPDDNHFPLRIRGIEGVTNERAPEIPVLSRVLSELEGSEGLGEL